MLGVANELPPVAGMTACSRTGSPATAVHGGRNNTHAATTGQRELLSNGDPNRGDARNANASNANAGNRSGQPLAAR